MRLDALLTLAFNHSTHQSQSRKQALNLSSCHSCTQKKRKKTNQHPNSHTLNTSHHKSTHPKVVLGKQNKKTWNYPQHTNHICPPHPSRTRSRSYLLTLTLLTLPWTTSITTNNNNDDDDDCLHFRFLPFFVFFLLHLCSFTHCCVTSSSQSSNADGAPILGTFGCWCWCWCCLVVIALLVVACACYFSRLTTQPKQSVHHPFSPSFLRAAAVTALFGSPP